MRKFLLGVLALFMLSSVANAQCAGGACGIGGRFFRGGFFRQQHSYVQPQMSYYQRSDPTPTPTPAAYQLVFYPDGFVSNGFFYPPGYYYVLVNPPAPTPTPPAPTVKSKSMCCDGKPCPCNCKECPGKDKCCCCNLECKCKCSNCICCHTPESKSLSLVK